MSEYFDDQRDRDPREEFRPPLPAFNVCIPFQRITMVQMNVPMRDLLYGFFQELVDDETEEEMIAFRDALMDPSVYVHATRPSEPSFLMCEKYMNVVVCELNDAMRKLVRDFISEVEGRVEDEIWALSRALKNPEASREIREQKRSNRNGRKHSPEVKPQGKIRHRKLTTQAS